jgi:hypothetical protein
VLCYIEGERSVPMNQCRCGAYFSPFCPVAIHRRKAEHQPPPPEMFWALGRIKRGVKDSD